MPEKGSTGKTGTLRWSFSIGGDHQEDRCHPIAIHSPILAQGGPCRRFTLDIGYSSVHVSPFSELRDIMTPYWKSLVARPFLQLDMGQGADSAFTAVAVLIGDDAFIDMPHGRKAWSEYRKKAPENIKVSGKPSGSTPSWFKLEDPDKLFEDYLRTTLRTAVRLHPETRVVKWDYEPERGGYDPEGRAHFAKELKLPSTPSIAEIGQNYRRQWQRYTLGLNARFIAKVARIVKEEVPDCIFIVTSEQIRLKDYSGWCDVDMRLIDQDPNIDFLEGMPYFCGPSFFDEVSHNLAVLRKPMLFAQDPSERIWIFYSRYTPKRLFQNILAVAALGGRGICHWPDDSMTAEYYQCFEDAYSLIARYEDIYFDGQRVDSAFTVRPQNTFTKTIRDGGQTHTIHHPDLLSTLRMIAHEHQGKLYFTLFNYHAKETVIARIQGRGWDILSSIPPNGAKVVEADQPEDQEALKKSLLQFTDRNQATPFQDLADGSSSVVWTLHSTGKPVLRLANAHYRADIDAMHGGELIGFRLKSGADPMAGGSAARLIFYDSNQPPLTFRQRQPSLQNGLPAVSFEAEVSPFDGVVPYENPLLGLRVTRTYTLTPDGLKISWHLFNPSKHTMKFGFRIWNYPRTGGRFGGRNLTLTCGDVTITTNSPENNFFFRTRPTEDKGTTCSYHPWKGEKAVSSATDSVQTETIEFIPNDGFDGIYVWNSNTAPGHTVELKTPEIQLQPETEIEFTYLLR